MLKADLESLTIKDERPKETMVGESIKRLEDLRNLTANTIFVDDMKLPKMVYMAVVRSNYAHAHIGNIDLSGLRDNPKVLGWVTPEEIISLMDPIPLLATPKGTKQRDIYPLATGKVRYVGEPVVAVACKERYDVEDVTELVNIEFQPLPAISDCEQAVSHKHPSSSILFDDWGDNIAYHCERRSGDVDEAFRNSDIIIDEKFKIQRQYGAPIEPRGVVADYDAASFKLTLYSSTQWPHIVRTVLSTTLHIAESKIAVVTPDVGGGFGSKQDIYPEEFLASILSIKLRTPVKWVPSRSEEILSTVHSREQVHYLKLGAKKDGKILGVQDKVIADLGAFHILSLGPQLVTSETLQGPYKIDNWFIDLYCVVTNKTPSGAYRGFGQPESTFVMERAIDILAKELKLDPVEVRFRNFIQSKEFPYTTRLGSLYDSGNYKELLSRGLELVEYERLRRTQIEERRTTNKENEKRIGIGTAFYVEPSGLMPSRLMATLGYKIYSGYESASVRIEPTGSVTVRVGLSPHGQGLDTVLSQVVSSEIGIRVNDVNILHGDTTSSPYGQGTWGSRSAVVGSAVVLKCLRKLIEKMKTIASHILDSQQINFENGYFSANNSKVSVKEIASVAYNRVLDLPKEMEPGLEEICYYDPPEVTTSYGVHFAVVEVDTESGSVRLLKYVAMCDCGTMLNPMIVEGQIHGGIAQGIAGGLLEELRYDENGQLLSGTFTDYAIPTCLELPQEVLVGHMETPSPFHPLGAKGVGEGGTIPPPAAIANAVADALSDFNVKVNETPLSPDRIFNLMRKKSSP
jgi:carbon-monoxide dehydrogenase large subunit